MLPSTSLVDRVRQGRERLRRIERVQHPADGAWPRPVFRERRAPLGGLEYLHLLAEEAHARFVLVGVPGAGLVALVGFQGMGDWLAHSPSCSLIQSLTAARVALSAGAS